MSLPLLVARRERVFAVAVAVLNHTVLAVYHQFDLFALRLLTPAVEGFCLGRIDPASSFTSFLSGGPTLVVRYDVNAFLRANSVLLWWT
jgi:hypothetical protein